ncbi:MAG TPA: c-type cytochrome [Bryobacteraceae bacterium]|nr:c-type cytochrome [Bryobacteraceae bacterium]
MWRSAILPICVCAIAFAQGRPATEAEIKARDFTILPNGTGLPKGHGDAVSGRTVYEQKCQDCHGLHGEGQSGKYPALAGGVGSLKSVNPIKTVGSYWPYATTLFDYIHRAMPYDHPRSLSTDDVYSVAAYVLFLNGIVTESQELNEKTLPQVKMPNRNGFVADPRPDVKSKK